MKEELINFGLTGLASWFIAVLSFLIGGELGYPSTPTAACAGIFSGLCIALSYSFGRMVAGESLNWKIFVAQILAALIFGTVGGVQMLL